MTGGKPNRLIHERSPYLLKHAYNPVDWYPWGEEAFSRAEAEDKPVFLSIGYSTCHWCHVMARESFENQQVAVLMNTSFVNIKVDREERPDIDHIYMTVALELMGTGGWPLTIVMTPDQRPFFAATYVPRESGLGLIGMLDLIPMINTAWLERREELLTAADKVTVLLGIPSAGAGQGGEGAGEVVARTLGDLMSNFDPQYGGFGGPPKFPTPHTLIFLIRTFQSTGDPDLLSMAGKTLRAMHAGGIYDHAGFGFHRYAMDASWLVPHFEKMLYDQALLAMAYTEAFRVTGQERCRAIAEEIFTYMTKDLRGSEGAFYSAEDAESGGREGGFYLWNREELGTVLSGTELAAFTEYYGICREGNIPMQGRTKSTGDNILHIATPGEEVAADLGILPGDL
ncbi:MAG: thioredoxin domain-containing protein, partial [Methanomicrobiales archaeon]|nr:thioredoxin domain-containing protein [Methanomicrobiales archaeon]